MLDPQFDTYPRGTNTVLFTEAYDLHRAASETYRLSNRIPPKGEAPAVTQQRKALLTIAAQLMVKQRNDLLDQFCTSWLRFRDLPVPKYEQPQGSSDVGGGGSRPPQDGVQAPLRGPSGDASSDDRSHQASTGEPLP